MDQLVLAFGINLKLLIIQIINFVVLAGILTYLLYKPVLKMLNDREAKIKQGIDDAENAAQTKASAQQEKQEILTKAETEAEHIDAQAKLYAKEKEKEIIAQAHDKAAELVKEAEAKSILLKEQARKDSEAEIAKLAILAAEKVLTKNA